MLQIMGCSSSTSRYKDMSALEKPPTLALQKRPQSSIDDSVELKDMPAGLDSNVVLVEESPKQLIIKQPIADAWRTLGRAILKSDIKITDYQKSKNYYVNYRVKGMLNNVIGLFKDEPIKTVYLLTLKQQGSETNIQAALASQSDQRMQNVDEKSANLVDDDEFGDDSDGLVEHLYQVLRDEIRLEP